MTTTATKAKVTTAAKAEQSTKVQTKATEATVSRDPLTLVSQVNLSGLTLETINTSAGEAVRRLYSALDTEESRRTKAAEAAADALAKVRDEYANATAQANLAWKARAVLSARLYLALSSGLRTKAGKPAYVSVAAMAKAMPWRGDAKALAKSLECEIPGGLVLLVAPQGWQQANMTAEQGRSLGLGRAREVYTTGTKAAEATITKAEAAKAEAAKAAAAALAKAKAKAEAGEEIDMAKAEADAIAKAKADAAKAETKAKAEAAKAVTGALSKAKAAAAEARAAEAAAHDRRPLTMAEVTRPLRVLTGAVAKAQRNGADPDVLATTRDALVALLATVDGLVAAEAETKAKAEAAGK